MGEAIFLMRNVHIMRVRIWREIVVGGGESGGAKIVPARRCEMITVLRMRTVGGVRGVTGRGPARWRH